MIEEVRKADSDMREKIRMTGQLSKQEIAEEMRKAAFLVFPSERETFGLVIAEAMAMGLPVVVGDRTAPPEFVDEDSGILVDPSDVEGLQDLIIAAFDEAAKKLEEEGGGGLSLPPGMNLPF